MRRSVNHTLIRRQTIINIKPTICNMSEREQHGPTPVHQVLFASLHSLILLSVTEDSPVVSHDISVPVSGNITA